MGGGGYKIIDGQNIGSEKMTAAIVFISFEKTNKNKLMLIHF